MLLTMVVASLPTLGQEFNSGSNGSDGTLNLTTPGEVLFDPRNFSPPLDPDGDGVYHWRQEWLGLTGVVLCPRR